MAAAEVEVALAVGVAAVEDIEAAADGGEFDVGGSLAAGVGDGDVIANV